MAVTLGHTLTYSALAALLFFIVGHPWLYDRTDRLTRVISKKLTGGRRIIGTVNREGSADRPSARVNLFGLSLHTVVFALLVWGIMALSIEKKKKVARARMLDARSASRNDGGVNGYNF